MIQHRHFIIYKPSGYMSQFVLPTNQKRKLLGELYDFPDKTMAIGRLDKTTEGLLLLTTNGKVSSLINGRKVEKEYYAQVDGEIDSPAIAKLQKGVEIGIKGQKYMTLPCEATLLSPPPIVTEKSCKIRDDRHGPTSWVSIVLKEGKFRQVRKMTAAVGFPTLRLFRVRIGGIRLEGMEVGEVLEVERFDI